MSNLEFVTFDTNGAHGRVATRPISVQEYRDYLRAAGQPVPPALAALRNTHGPAVYVSHASANDYCRWLGSQDHQRYRLPSVAELLQLAGASGVEGTSEEMWPHSHGERPEIQGARHAVYYCEWTREIEKLPTFSGGEPRVLGSVFYPPWLREGNNPKQIQAMMLASQGFSFVSFRVAADL